MPGLALLDSLTRAEVRPNYESDWAVITAVAQRLGVGTAETVRKWVRQTQVDTGQRPGVSTGESAELRRLWRENAELRLGIRCGAAAGLDLRGGPSGFGAVTRSHTLVAVGGG
jgi:hypothetical protein